MGVLSAALNFLNAAMLNHFRLVLNALKRDVAEIWLSAAQVEALRFMAAAVIQSAPLSVISFLFLKQYHRGADFNFISNCLPKIACGPVR